MTERRGGTRRPAVRRVGIIGYPIRHSLSPVFQQAAFDFHNIPAKYEAWETKRDEVAAAVERLRQPEYFGMNVTVPYKLAVIPLLDEVTPLAQRIGAVNTIVKRDGRLQGHNTDAAGFLRALERDAGYSVEEKRAVVIGAGGAARAVVFALVEAKVGALLIANRRVERAEALRADLVRELDDETTAEVVKASGILEESLRTAVAEADLLVNATSVGMLHTPYEQAMPIPEKLLHRGLLVYDLVYNPAQTPLLRAAADRGAAYLNGLPMLIYQGAAAFELWTGRRAPIGLMMQKARDALYAISS